MEDKMSVSLKEVDKVEITTLQDNYIDLVSRDNTEVVFRAMPLKDMEVKNSVLAEHGFSSLVTLTAGDSAKSMIFDFGFSENGAAFNAEALSLDLSVVEAYALSHGHMDHFGGMVNLVKLAGKKADLVLHPECFRKPRYVKVTEEFKVMMPSLTRDFIKQAGLNVVESTDPYPMLSDTLLFLGEIPKKTDFEKGMPNFYYEKDGVETHDDIIDDTAIVANLKGKGLVVLSGCAHSGIVNTVNHAKEVTGVDRVHAIMGGFHLTGPDMAPVVPPTIKGLKGFNPDYVIPTHCTGRDSIMKIEAEMPDRFIVNMAGTKLTFAA
jgi:7,8-dihydropterin-6-yl-methyl-4-(beta-D-ribofuranosyl)aminobenzene 5'-phosphate synthase